MDHLTLLLGAGASTSSGLPDWDTLAVRLLVRTKQANESAARLLVSKQDPLLVAEAARAALGSSWISKLRASLYEGTIDISPSPLHLAAAAHLLSGSGDTTLLTLNFDTLLEDAIADGGSNEVISDAEGLIPDHSNVVHHLHGILNKKTARKVVMTLSDFNDLLGTEDSWQLNAVRTALKRGALVIAGTSYRDPDVRRWLHVAFEDQPLEHAALVLLARQAFGMTLAEFEEIKDVLASEWRAAGLEPILLQDHTDAAQIVRELRTLQAVGYRAPQDRARELWNAHETAFDYLQRTYSDRLLEDARIIQDAMEVESLNLTLWLADGNGSLARWAAQDRYYRDVHELRRVATGHDSPWIAGQALGAEEVLFMDLDDGITRRWRSVLAVPVSVRLDGLAEFASAVISVGLPGSVGDYERNRGLWLEALLTVANDWSSRLTAPFSTGSSPTLE
jgi:hypothetical protein